MNREERKKRIEYLVQKRKKQEEKLRREQQITEILEVFPEKEKVEILDDSESGTITRNMTGCFPIAFWGGIDWDKVHNKIFLTSDDIFTIPTVLSNHSFDTSVPVYLIAGDYNTPVVKTSLFTILEKLRMLCA
ncbi:hypothetical protein [Neobacillus sp. CF12]|uniref:CDI toxin immunity protein n=1 Tax=Neobacillus sp. CF12 TaxID=3055864 RepID=UPI0025A2BC96|nr:hypothetical protein [Neobacillus sp. CF12]MDM5326964.1 hypothetical protein [Neobacillus sp. CF12]